MAFMITRVAATESYFYENCTLIITFEWHKLAQLNAGCFCDSYMSHLIFSMANRSRSSIMV